MVTTLPRQFDRFVSFAADAVGNLYFTYQNSVLKMSNDGAILSTLAGDANAGYVDGSGSTARFSRPYGIAVDEAGKVYVSDGDNKAIRNISPSGVVTTMASGLPGYPGGVAVGANGNVYVRLGGVIPGNTDGGVVIGKVNANGSVMLVAGDGLSGQIDGPGSVARFTDATAMAVDRGGNVYVADKTSIRKIAP